MRQKLPFIVIFSLWFNLGYGQSLHETYDFATRSYEQGNYASALTELQRVAYFDSTSQYPDVFLKIAHTFDLTGDYPNAIKYYRVVSRRTESDSLKNECLLDISMCYLKNREFLFSLNELYSMEVPADSLQWARYHLLLASALYGANQYQDAGSMFKMIVSEEDTGEVNTQIASHLRTIKRFKPGKVKTMSLIMPGLGQIYCGKIGNGINSVVLVFGLAAVGVLTYNAFGVVDALLSVASWYYRYYTGGIKNAASLAHNKIEEHKAETYQDLLQLVYTTGN